MKKITVLLADDLASVEGGPHLLLDADQEIRSISKTTNGHHDPAPAKGLFPDAAVLDVVMPLLLRHLSRQILEIQEEERKRIGRKLHDEVGQALANLHVNLMTLKQATGGIGHRLKKKIADVQTLLEQAMESVQQFSRELRPTMLEDLGLIPTLRSYVKTFAEQTGVRVCFSACVGVEKLDGERKIVLYRIAQESLIHVAKHAQATEVEINIRNLKQGIRMEMRDNGKTLWTHPASTNGERKTLSLLGVQERVRLVNGDFEVESEPGKGTILRVLVPLKAG